MAFPGEDRNRYHEGFFGGVVTEYQQATGEPMPPLLKSWSKQGIKFAFCGLSDVAAENDLFKRAGFIGYAWAHGAPSGARFGAEALTRTIIRFLESEGAAAIGGPDDREIACGELTTVLDQIQGRAAERTERAVEVYRTVIRECARCWVCALGNERGAFADKACHR